MHNEERLTIFIIEDNKMFSLLLETELKKVLDGRDHNIHVFENGELCRLFLHIKPQLVFVDYHLNSVDANAMNGLNVINMIRETHADTDFIMVTNDEETGLFLQSQKTGVYDYLIKGSGLPYKLDLSFTQWLKLKAKQQNQNL